jgi:hypothetical protein
MGFAAGDSNLYRYVNNKPTNATDPSGLIGIEKQGDSPTVPKGIKNPLPGGTFIKGNEFGNWMYKQTNTDGVLGKDGAKSKNARSAMILRFFPTEKYAQADDIAFVQIIKVQNNDTKAFFYNPNDAGRKTEGGWHVDRVEDRNLGWYAHNDDGTVGKNFGIPWNKDNGFVEYPDTPQDDDPNFTWSFQTYAIVKSGQDEGRVLGGISWGFIIDKQLKVQSLKTTFIPTPTKEFFASVKAWNLQALGPKDKSNAPKGKQEVLGGCPFWY